VNDLAREARRIEIARAVAAAIITNEGYQEDSMIDPQLRCLDIATRSVRFADLLLQRLEQDEESGEVPPEAA